MKRLAIAVLELYPAAWRARYRAEMRALLLQRPVGAREILDLVRGAADAHVHPEGHRPAPVEQLRGTAAAALAAWIAFAVCGAAFAKLTEDHPYAAAGSAHPLLGGARIAIAALALASVAIVLIGGARLILDVVREAAARREPRLVVAAAAGPAAVGALAAATAGVSWLVSGGRLKPDTTLAWIVLGAWALAALTGAVACAIAPRAALRLARPRESSLRAGALGALALTGTILLITLATAVYIVAIEVDAPVLAAESNGPLSLLSTTAALAIVLALMAAVCALAVVTSARGLRALRAGRAG